MKSFTELKADILEATGVLDEAFTETEIRGRINKLEKVAFKGLMNSGMSRVDVQKYIRTASKWPVQKIDANIAKLQKSLGHGTRSNPEASWKKQWLTARKQLNQAIDSRGIGLSEAKSPELKQIDKLVKQMEDAVSNNDKKAYKKAEDALTAISNKLQKAQK